VLRIVNMSSSVAAKANNNVAVPTNAIVGTILVLTACSFFLNILFLLIVLIFKGVGKSIDISKFLLWFNLILIPIQIWYYFFSKI
jgi:hypothetical protein